MNYDEMPAGREMDALVAEKVMGWGPHEGCEHSETCMVMPNSEFHAEPSRYSTDISAAWEVVEKIAEEEYAKICVEHLPTGDWYCNAGLGWAYGYTAPLAICRAALKATGSNPVAGENATPEEGGK